MTTAKHGPRTGETGRGSDRWTAVSGVGQETLRTDKR